MAGRCDRGVEFALREALSAAHKTRRPPVAINAIISYDDSLNDHDALMFGHVLSELGARLTLAYVRHATRERPDHERLDASAADALLARGAAWLEDTTAERRIVVSGRPPRAWPGWPAPSGPTWSSSALSTGRPTATCRPAARPSACSSAARPRSRSRPPATRSRRGTSPPWVCCPEPLTRPPSRQRSRSPAASRPRSSTAPTTSTCSSSAPAVMPPRARFRSAPARRTRSRTPPARSSWWPAGSRWPSTTLVTA